MYAGSEVKAELGIIASSYKVIKEITSMILHLMRRIYGLIAVKVSIHVLRLAMESLKLITLFQYWTSENRCLCGEQVFIIEFTLHRHNFQMGKRLIWSIFHYCRAFVITFCFQVKIFEIANSKKCFNIFYHQTYKIWTERILGPCTTLQSMICDRILNYDQQTILMLF